MLDVAEGYYWARIERTAEVEIVQIISSEGGVTDFSVIRMGSEQWLGLDQIKFLSQRIPMPIKYY
jgi:hypothetical protein